MPVVLPILGVRDTISTRQYGENAYSTTTSSSVVWIVAAVVGGIIFIGATLGSIAMCYTKRRQHQRAQELGPYLTRGEFIRRRKMSAADLFQEEEERRRYMIRKSLASRSTNSIGSGLSATADQIDRELTEMERRESTRLKDDWKRWEARERRVRSMSGGQHPATSADSGVPILSIPTPAKHRSPGRMPVLSLPPGVPVPPPRHPGRRSSS
ncbi:hypothetical protein MFIFM68171_09391 [Madurella fahalii]|uniref:Uncharacterized protein n=1 Tax=Madurella fahalii TaxID=1157608 RepID=A0ABQ0GN85_9PEZI